MRKACKQIPSRFKLKESYFCMKNMTATAKKLFVELFIHSKHGQTTETRFAQKFFQ